MFAKFLIAPVSCPNCESAGELTRMLFFTENYDGCAWGITDGHRYGSIMGIALDPMTIAIQAKMICPVCDFTTSIVIALDFVEPVIRLNGIGEVAHV